ncbi:MAG: malectin domain-containing carbohydrate-binding protein [Bacteroidia bacterium]|nr:malectin domain-containing carbohydrate-binding protein [Bacteroidia bacterium]
MKNVNPTLTLAIILFSFTQSFAQLPFARNFGPTIGCEAGSNGYFYAGEVTSTTYDAIYTEECYYQNTKTIRLSPPLTTGVTYTMFLHFTEIYFGKGNPVHTLGDGARIFHIDVDGVRVLTNFDIHANVGPRAAMVFQYDFVADADGFADITLTPVVNNAKISAVEIVAQGSTSAFPPTSTIIDLNNTTFPVEWFEINAESRGNNAQITWTTAWESNNAGFEVQMGNVGGSFETVSFVEGAGTTTEPTSYQFTTEALSPGSYVFRLKQRDFDGQISLSPMVEVTIGEMAGISMQPLMPNPAIDYTLIRFFGHEGDDVRLTIHTLYGQQVAEVFKGKLDKDGQHSFPVSTETMAAGYYFVQLVQGRNITTQRLLISPK